MPIIKMGMANTTAVMSRRSNFICSLRYIRRAISSDDGGWKTVTASGGDVELDMTDNIVRIVNSGAEGV